MKDQEKVWRHLTSLGGNAARGAVVAALALSMVPTAALAEIKTETGSTATNTVPASAQAEGQTPSNEDYTAAALSAEGSSGSSAYDLSKIADGTYEGSAFSDPDDSLNAGDEWDSDGYDVTVKVTVASGKISKVEVGDYDNLGNNDWDRMDKAVNGYSKRGTTYTGVVDQINAKGSTEGIDAVSTATISSNAIVAATDNALQKAYDEQNPVVSEYTYGYAALTWAEYWAAEDVYNATDVSSSDDVDRDAGNGVYEHDRGGYDVVTRATMNHGLHRGSFQCVDVIETAEGVQIKPSYYPDKKSFVDVDGKTWTVSGSSVSDGANTYTITGHEVTGLKYVPVKVKTAELEAFKAAYDFVANGETLQGGFSENNLTAYMGAVAEVDAETSGLKVVTKAEDGSFSFGAAKTDGTTSGIKGQALKTASNIDVAVVRTTQADTEDADTFHTGSFGEFLRVDLTGDGYGDLGANMQAVTWTYYGNDSTYTKAVATYGTKFAADNWMHKSMGIQLGLTESARCELPEGTDGTGYWKITVHALGYEDYSFTFQATSDNIAKAAEPVSDETKKKLKDLYDEAAALKQDDYTAESWSASAIETELAETKGLLEKEGLTEAEASEQLGHLQAAIDALVKADAEYTYGYAALTWAEYWAAEDVQAAGSADSSDTLDSHGEYDKGAFDVVTRATVNHGLHRGSYQCTATIKCTDGTEFSLATWAADGSSFTTTDGKTVTWNRGAMTCDGQSYTMAEYDVEGLKYVPVKVKTAELEAFKAAYTFVENGGTLTGGYGEKNLVAYSVTAEVDADTNGLKTATKAEDGSFSFGAAKTDGTTSGIKGQALKTVENVTPTVKAASGSYGEFLRVDITGDGYGDLGANMQTVTWTYYGSDSSRTTALATYGTKFAADNWMHKSMGIQLGLTESARCELPTDTDGTGYWTLTVHALGYADYTYEFEATSENIAEPTPVTDKTKASLESLAATANAKIEGNYSAETWASFETELVETNDLLQKADLTESEALTQISHLTEAMNALVRTAPAAGDYVVMNIPYSEFYAAETANNDTSVDVFTSATKNKTKGTLSAGTYHTEDGSEITGISFAVKVTESAAEGIDWSAYTKVDSVEGLASAASYAYATTSEDPATYKEISVSDEGKVSFSKTNGAEATVLDGSAEAKFTTESTYGDYELDFKSDSSVYAALKDATIYGAVLNTTDGTGYGLRHLENIWKTGKHGVEFAWCTGFTDAVHGCPTSSEHYESIMGKTLSSVTVYTSAGTFEVGLGDDGIYVPLKSKDVSIAAEDVNADAADAVVKVEAALPRDFDAEYTIDGEPANQLLTGASLSFSADGLSVGEHTLKATDKSGKYAVVSDDFVVSTAVTVAQYDTEKAALVKAEDATDEQLANYLGNIASVEVDGAEYAAQGRGAAKIFNAANGAIDFSATSGMGASATKVFGSYGAYSLKVKATGYTADLEFTVTYEADKAELKAAIENVGKDLVESDYSKDSWSALVAAVEAGQKVVDNVEATDDEVEAAAKAIADARAALAPNPQISLKESIEAAEKLTESDYTATSWKSFSAVLADAKKVNADASATDAQVMAAAEALADAKKALVHAPTTNDTTDLKVEIGRADALEQSAYTADSWKAYQAALEDAKKVEANESASQSEVQAATKSLAAARESLVKKTSESGQTSNGSGSNNTSNGSGNQANQASTGAPASKKTPLTSDPALAAGGVAGLGAMIAGAAAAIRRRLQR